MNVDILRKFKEDNRLTLVEMSDIFGLRAPSIADYFLKKNPMIPDSAVKLVELIDRHKISLTPIDQRLTKPVEYSREQFRQMGEHLPTADYYQKIGIKNRTYYNWVSGLRKVHPTTAKLIFLMREFGEL